MTPEQKDHYTTYTLDQRDQVRDVLQSIITKHSLGLEEEQIETAQKIINRLALQTEDNQLITFNYEEGEMLDRVEQGLWRN